MAKQISDAQLKLSYRLGESAAPTNTAELEKRRDWFKDAINTVLAGDEFMWFMQKVASDCTVADQQPYALPTRYRKMVQVKVDGYRYIETPMREIYEKYETPSSIVPLSTAYLDRTFYLFDEQVYFMPTPSSAPSAVTATSVTGVIATSVVTVTKASHGLVAGDFVTVAGASDSAYNGTFRITVVTADTFCYSTTTTISNTDPTGTITYTKNNIVYWYFEYPAEPTAETSGIVLPDEYIDILASFAEGRYWSIAHKRAKSADAFTEFEKRVKDLKLENFRKKFSTQ